MKIGTLQIDSCNDCPAYKWNGESLSNGDQGCCCEFGAFGHAPTGAPKPIPENCPINIWSLCPKPEEVEV